MITSIVNYKPQNTLDMDTSFTQEFEMSGYLTNYMKMEMDIMNLKKKIKLLLQSNSTRMLGL